MADLRPAATVLILRDSATAPEVFMVRRHDNAAFMAGAHVFPGGVVDASDRQTIDPSWCDGVERAQSQLAGLDPLDAVACHIAAARELFEEAGVLLARDGNGALVRLVNIEARARASRFRGEVHAGTRTLRSILEEEQLRLALDELTFCAHWVTPPLDSRRFDTRFFVARLPLDQAPMHDEQETTEGSWLTAAEAIEAATAREIVLPPPTWIMLQELEPFESVDDVIEWAEGATIERREPGFEKTDDSKALIMPPPFNTRFVWVGDRWLPEQIARR